MNFFKTYYRIVSDTYSGYEVQEWNWYRPFWRMTNFCNTFSSLEKAQRFIKGQQGYPLE